MIYVHKCERKDGVTQANFRSGNTYFDFKSAREVHPNQYRREDIEWWIWTPVGREVWEEYDDSGPQVVDCVEQELMGGGNDVRIHGMNVSEDQMDARLVRFGIEVIKEWEQQNS